MREKRLEIVMQAVALMTRSTGATIDELGEVLGRKRNAVNRLLRTMTAMGIPIYPDMVSEERKKRWKIDSRDARRLPGLLLTELGLDPGEIEALFLLRSGMAVNPGSDMDSLLDQALAKIARLAPHETVQRIGGMSGLCTPLPRLSKDYSGKERVIETLVRAVLEQRVCTVTYFSFADQRAKTYDVHPLQFLERWGGLYVFVWSRLREAVRVLAVERIQTLEITQERFTRPADFDPRGLVCGAFRLTFNDPVEATVLVRPGEARYVRERCYFNRQRIQELKDGSIIIRLNTSGRHDVKRWIMSLGPGARVLAPEELRREIMEDLGRALDGHGQSDPLAAAARSNPLT